jgi:hypothetical protein
MGILGANWVIWFINLHLLVLMLLDLFFEKK